MLLMSIQKGRYGNGWRRIRHLSNWLGDELSRSY
ncbi:hypothetical protein EDC54_106148 [Samsonia erythrinae]|uniref:Uncharacterized protein n=1 Tax=Samsonia erythrinae TaxID=160434 RepID=A0A4R3VNA0_9GAMM|nr:hypothetical protein EDC54_106148 [Samsonia erythrinae]